MTNRLNKYGLPECCTEEWSSVFLSLVFSHFMVRMHPTQKKVLKTQTHTLTPPPPSPHVCMLLPISFFSFLLLIFKELSTGDNFTTHITPWWSHSFRYWFKASQVPLKIKPQISGPTNQFGDEGKKQKTNTFNRQVVTWYSKNRIDFFFFFFM